MAAPIGPGDWVECINDGSKYSPVTPLIVGAIYCVRDVEDYEGRPIVKLHEIEPPRPHTHFEAHLFRPIYRPKSSIIEQLKKPISEPVRELLPID